MSELIAGNEWQPPAATGEWADVIEPATGEALGRIRTATAADVATAAKRAAGAQPEWAAVPGPQRAALIRRAARILEDNRAEFERWLVREGGSIPGKAAFEVDLTLGELWEAAALPTQPWGHLLATSEPGRDSIARRVPLGVVGVISPWNFPLILSMRAVAPALALGNAVLLKPDLQTAVSGGMLVARLFEEAGLPAGVLNVLPGDAEPGAALAEDPTVAMIAFTGSTAVGREVGAAAGRTLKRVSLKRVSLELGGDNALIVLDDADLEVASSAGAWGAFLHQGQVCMTAGRHIVLESVADEYLDRLAKRAANLPVGNPFTEQVALGPLINERQAANVERIVSETVARGAEVRAGGIRNGLFFEPTVLAGVTPAMPAFREEIFGPVAPVVVVADETEAVAVANDDAFAPFGGVGASGNGSRFGSQSSWDEFTSWQWVTSRAQAHGFPF